MKNISLDWDNLSKDITKIEKNHIQSRICFNALTSAGG